MRYSAKPETNLFHPPEQGCLPKILQLPGISPKYESFKQARPARIISVDWENIAKGYTNGVVYQLDGGSAPYLTGSAPKIQKAIMEQLPKLSTGITIRMLDYLNDLREK